MEYDADHSFVGICDKHGLQIFTVTKPRVCYECMREWKAEFTDCSAYLIWLEKYALPNA